MSYLLDTCTWLWMATDSAQLSASARSLCVDPRTELFVSSISSWEITVKYSLKRLSLTEAPGSWLRQLDQGVTLKSLPFDEESACHAARLPAIHRDPFDRMLVCQAIVHGLTIITPDPHIREYPIRTLW